MCALSSDVPKLVVILIFFVHVKLVTTDERLESHVHFEIIVRLLLLLRNGLLV